jgi:hypothetical protein
LKTKKNIQGWGWGCWGKIWPTLIMGDPTIGEENIKIIDINK